MSYRTLEVNLENGSVRPVGAEKLPDSARALLTLLDSSSSQPAAQSCGELAKKWSQIGKLPHEDAVAFADDVENARAKLQPPMPKWD